MNFEFANQVNTYLEKFLFQQAISIGETKLSRLPKNEFQSINGLSLLHHVEDLVYWINNFYLKLSKTQLVKALYFEINEFDINTSEWYIYGFGYEVDGGLDVTDMEWLCDVSRETATEDEFILKGFEKIQTCFAKYEEYLENELVDENLENARDWAEQIVISRYMELMRSSHLKAKELNLPWSTIPIYFTEHEYTFIVKSEN